ncbi:MAG: DoxX family protein [Planctomycetes bacterium]|nr:DoxX family protein [Planctomycetota bacterium]MCB9904959.1 DoxX family protein [Planctomycetota bacterium]
MNQSTRSDLGLLALRLMIGAVFAFHGAGKLFGWFGGYGIEGTAGFFEGLGIPFPVLSVVFAGATEFFGGLLLMAGFGVRLVAAPLAFTMLVASFTAHAGAFNSQAGGMEFPLTLAVAAAALGLLGPGRFACAPRFSAKRRLAPAA